MPAIAAPVSFRSVSMLWAPIDKLNRVREHPSTAYDDAAAVLPHRRAAESLRRGQRGAFGDIRKELGRTLDLAP